MDLKTSKITKIIIAVAIITIIFFFLGKTLYVSWSEIAQANIKPNIVSLVVSLILFVCSFLLGFGFAWFLTLRLFNRDITFWQAVRTSAFAQFGKYIPGKVWAFGGRVYFAKKYGVGEVETITALLIETVTSTASAIILFILSLFTYKNLNVPFNMYLLLIFIPLSFVVIHPKVLTSILKTLFALLRRVRMLKRNIVLPELQFTSLLVIYLFYFLYWIVHTIGFYFVTNAIFPIPFCSALGVMGAYAMSWTIGFLVILVPGGFGIREGLLTIFLQNFMPLSFATLMAFVGRLWTTIGEILYFFVSLIKKQ
ncbi:hypothetical protein AMJ52_06695 [candidate division TA06 bacterium DG_78]|uniref:Uncharacterized protein n=1 Tax=candidate division TA06 bacterium DG_78 TaxID=1703772 RepID=A0A0S7YC73_UNCT6|nr:MAG: hypothetical protein AMJ52_06695 [candidate division TA06 bacterium DG_78]